MWLSQPRAEQAPERLLLNCLLNSVLQAEDGGEAENKKGRVWFAVPSLAMTSTAGEIGITWRVFSPNLEVRCSDTVPFLPDEKVHFSETPQPLVGYVHFEI